MNDLDEKEQKHVRTALRFLRVRCGEWKPIIRALRFRRETICRVVAGAEPVSASMAIRVARLAGVPIDDLLAGRFAPAGTCPHCGHAPDFADGDTKVEDQ